MKLKISRSFLQKLDKQIDFIAKDKPGAARKFKHELLDRIKQIPEMPFKNRKSIFFDRDEIRDLTFKGYLVVYKVNPEAKEIEVFGFVKYEDKL